MLIGLSQNQHKKSKLLGRSASKSRIYQKVKEWQTCLHVFVSLLLNAQVHRFKALQLPNPCLPFQNNFSTFVQLHPNAPSIVLLSCMFICPRASGWEGNLRIGIA